MKNKIKTILISSTVLASSVMHAMPEASDAEKKETKVENVQKSSEQKNAFERGMTSVTSSVRTGVGYLAEGISFPIRAIGNLFEYTAVKSGQAVALTGDDINMPVVGEYVGTLARVPGDLIYITLDTTSDVIRGTINNTANIFMSGLDSTATMTRDPKGAGENFLGSLKKSVSYDRDNPAVNTFNSASFVFVMGKGLVLKTAYTATHLKDDLASFFSKDVGENAARMPDVETIKLLTAPCQPEKVASKNLAISSKVIGDARQR